MNSALILANGLLPTRGSVMLDVVFVAIFLIPIVLTWSLYLVRVKRNYRLHKRVQIVSGVIVLVTLVAFEVDLRIFTDWRALAADSPLFASGWVDRILWVHLCFAVPTPFVWAITIVMAVRRFPADPQPGPYSKVHRRWGWTSAVLMYLTALSGCVFYVAAFVL